jgi:ATP-dependent DNA helicase RecG
VNVAEKQASWTGRIDMGRTFNRLQRVLKLESEQGYQNKAVVGGIRQFAVFWVEQAREEMASEADLALVEQVAEVLAGYGRLPGVEARAKAIESLITSLRRREERLPAQATAPTPPTRPRSPVSKADPAPEARKRAAMAAEKRHSRAQKPTARRRTMPDREDRIRPLPGERRKTVPVAVPPAEPDPDGMAQPVSHLRGVGVRIEQLLQRLGAYNIWDLLYLFPRRYDDYTLMKPIKDLTYGEQVTVIGTIWETRARRTRSNQVMVQSIISDGTANIQATWFNQKWLAEKLKAGMQIVLSGKVDQYLGRLVFNSPEWEPLELEPLRTRRIVPVYPLTKGLNSNKMRDILRTAVSAWSAYLPDPLPSDLRKRHNLYTLAQAIQQIHFPDSRENLHLARRRLIFDELFLLQVGMLGQRQTWQIEPGIPVPIDPVPLIRLQNALPFELTNAQQRVIREITEDMARDLPMNRLLQGDVGSGKTVVAAAAILAVTKAGMQAALMAPTEILAEQHFEGLSKLLADQGVIAQLLTGSTSPADKERIYDELATGNAQVVIGTHALIQKSVEFRNLALAVIDEQHRFGVEQRRTLAEKGVQIGARRSRPHLLVMSATPIPRTLALSLFADLDLSILDEMPPGRQEIKTSWLRPSERERGYAFIQGQVEQGRQAYIIYPLVEESDKVDAMSAVEEYERLKQHVFPDLRISLIHGRLKSEAKESTMRAFHDGAIDVLVATSVIEVGVDVPNSTVMLIEGANRFGLAQLHQFRGRVGRGEYQSYCLLIADQESADAEERLRALEQTNDGFQLAEKDLELRGPGEFFGRRQSGLPQLRLATLFEMELLETARDEAESMLGDDPSLERPEHRWLREHMVRFWEKASDVTSQADKVEPDAL